MSDPTAADAPTALVTGASRGIGRAIALGLAKVGFDVAITARTVHDADPTAFEPDTGAPLPGSLDTTAAAIDAVGRRAVPIALDLLDPDALAPVVGLVLDISSGAGQLTPRHPVGEGGWTLSYAVTKAGFHRIADMIALECGDLGVRAFNLNPGFVATERVRAVRELAFVADRGIAPGVVGRVVAWFATTGQHRFENGTYHQLPEFARELGYLP